MRHFSLATGCIPKYELITKGKAAQDNRHKAELGADSESYHKVMESIQDSMTLLKDFGCI